MRAIATTLAALAALAPPVALHAQELDDVEIRVQPVADGLYMLEGRGGNIGVSVGADGVFLVDDQFAPLTERILAAIREITAERVRFVFNTHWHGDHTGGNENLGRAGALLVAHENVRERLSMDQVLERVGRPADTVPAVARGAWPVVTFTRDISFHLNGDDVQAFHVERAHTDGDAIVHFRRANVVHMGDTFFRDRFPFIDTASGGSIDGLLEALDRALERMDAGTRVIPGHGALSGREDVVTYRDALGTMRDRIARAMSEGRGLEQIVASRPIADFAERWGQSEAAERSFVETLYRSLGARR